MTKPDPLDGETLSRVYSERFSEGDLAFKEKVWRVLCDRVFQRYVAPTDIVLDLGAGSCEFINAINCAQKIAVDLNPDVRRHAREARVVVTPSTDLSPIADGTVNVVFTSNFLEHLPDKRAVLTTLAESYRVLTEDGLIIVLMPNIRYLAGRYWDYFDHHTPLSHPSLVEALRISGFRPERVVPRFLPYTVKGSRAPRSTLLLHVYLTLPFLWPVFGRQMLVVARREHTGLTVDRTAPGPTTPGG